MKKKLLFVIPSLGVGGAEKSLVNLLNTIDFNQFDVDLILLNHSGVFLKLLPSQVSVVPLNDNYQTFTLSLLPSIFKFITQGKLSLAINRFLYSFKIATINNKGFAEQHSWNYLKKSISKLPTHYDVAIGFLEKSSNYFVVDCVEATTKIGFIHNDYNQLSLDATFDLPYFKQLSSVVTVSELCVVALQTTFPSLQSKFQILYNIVSPALINKMANEVVSIDTTRPVLLSVGRLHPQKGFDIAVKAASIMKASGLNFVWYLIGEGEERLRLEREIADKGLQNNFILLGVKENPYPYIKGATIVVQPSRYEGKSIALDEAKILHRPIIATNFTTAKDQIDHLKNGIITEMNPESLAKSIIHLLEHPELQEQFSLYLSTESLGSESEIFKFYKLFTIEH